jgi:hypothetical protein
MAKPFNVGERVYCRALYIHGCAGRPSVQVQHSGPLGDPPPPRLTRDDLDVPGGSGAAR